MNSLPCLRRVLEELRCPAKTQPYHPLRCLANRHELLYLHVMLLELQLTHADEWWSMKMKLTGMLI
jgi:hypothetical protein